MMEMNPTETKAERLTAELSQFYGTGNYHKFNVLFRKHVLTDGAKFLADKAGAYWLMDAIASHHGKCRKDPMLANIQFWTLKVEDGKGTLTCERDKGNVAITQDIEFTDFPLEEIKLYCARADDDLWVIMLPIEY